MLDQNTTSANATSPLFLTPLHPKTKLTGVPKGQTSQFGYHMPGCNQDLPDGSSVDEHGPMCEHPVGRGVGCLQGDGQLDRIVVHRVRSYNHGVYREDQVRSSRAAGATDGLIRLATMGGLDDSIASGVVAGQFLTPSAARSIAAALVAAADRAESLQ